MRLNKSIKYTLLLSMMLFIGLIANVLFVGDSAHAEDITTDDYSGLWRTGVNDSNKKLGPNLDDSHWTYNGAFNNATNSSLSQDTCQSTARDGKPAKTVYERGESPYGTINGDRNAGIGANWPNSNDLNGMFSWKLINNNARWISRNAEGLHDSSGGCPDPSGPPDPTNAGVRYSNTFSFKLKDNFTIKDGRGINKDSLRLKMSVQTDNLIRVKVNGNTLYSTGGSTGGATCSEFDSFLSTGADHDGYICPEFTSNALSNLELANGDAFNFGDKANELTVEIFSTYPNVGFFINDISLTGTKGSIPVTGDCRPIPKYTIPKSTNYGEVSGNSKFGDHIESGPQIVEYGFYDNGVLKFTNSSPTSSVIKDITSEYTDGKSHNITIRETSNHVTNYTPTYGSTCDESDPKTGACIKSHDYFAGWNISTSGPNSVSTAPAPASFICFDYKLSSDFKLLNLANQNRPEGGTSFGISANIINDSFTKDNEPWKDFYNKYKTNSQTKKTRWQISTLKIGKGVDLPSYTRSGGIGINQDPCSYYGFGPGCESSKILNMKVSDNNLIIGAGGSYSVNQPMALLVPDEEVGTKYCFAFSIAPSTSENKNDSDTENNSGWTHSSFSKGANCFIIAKKPKTQVWGGDLFVGRSIDGASARDSKVQSSTTVKSNKTYGSWIEYGILASSSISGTASGSAYNDGLISATVCKYGKLSFTNAGDTTSCSDSTPKGYYKTNRSVPNIINGFQIKSDTDKLTGKIDLNGLDSNDSQAYAAGNIIIEAQSVNLGKTVIIKSDGDVYIKGNISYTEPSDKYKNLSQIPQVIIIAKNIRISSDVTRIDSWLVASNLVNTCWRGGGDSENSLITAYVCNNKLVVNGPVVANYLYLRRTAGSDAGSASGDPAEVVNLRADAYLWSYYKASSSGNIVTVYNTEVPVRF